MQPTRRSIREGLLVLGSAGALVRVVDGLGIIVVLWFLREDELGIASIVWTVGMLFEALVGLGIAHAVVQARRMTALALHTTFWFATGSGVALALLQSALGHPLAWFFGIPALAPMLVVAALKLPALGMAVVPTQRLQRALRFREIGAAQVVSTLLAAFARIALAAAGAGAWALVIAHMLHGVFQCMVVYAIAPHRPRLRGSLVTLRPLLVFGSKAGATELVMQLHRNVDYLIVGKLLGPSALGVYRAAFDLAMEPVVAIGDVVGRTSLAVLSRAAGRPEEREAAFVYTLGLLGSIMLPVLVFVAWASPLLFDLLPGARFEGAAQLVPVLALAAWFRVIFQAFRPLLVASGHPDAALSLAVFASLVLVGVLSCLVTVLSSRLGVLSAAIAWAVSAPISATAAAFVARRRLGIPLRRQIVASADPLLAAVVLLVAVALGRHALPFARRAGDVVAIVLQLAVVSVAFAAFVRIVRGSRAKALRPKRELAEP